MIKAALDSGGVAPTGGFASPGADEGSAPPSEGGLLTLRAAIRELPRRQRDALFLRYYLDFDYAAIAATLGVEVGTVSATLHAARSSLRDSLQEVYG